MTRLTRSVQKANQYVLNLCNQLVKIFFLASLAEGQQEFGYKRINEFFKSDSSPADGTKRRVVTTSCKVLQKMDFPDAKFFSVQGLLVERVNYSSPQKLFDN